MLDITNWVPQKDRAELGVKPVKPSTAAELVAKLRDLHDGQSALPDVISLGTIALAPLRDLLFERDPSGIYQPRVLAARALGRMGANDVLLDFLVRPFIPTDAIEQSGEEAVTNAAAEALAANQYAPAFAVLRWLVAVRPDFIGVVRALSAYDRPDAIPELIYALSDDGSRPAAEEGLRRIGLQARSSLVAYVAEQARNSSPAAINCRRSALRLLMSLGLPKRAWKKLAPLMLDSDSLTSALASGLAILHGPPEAHRSGHERLLELAKTADFRLGIEIEAILALVKQKGR